MKRKPNVETVRAVYTSKDDVEYRLVGTISGRDPGRCSGPPDQCYPPEGGDVEITEIYRVTNYGIHELPLMVNGVLTLFEEEKISQDSFSEYELDEMAEKLAEVEPEFDDLDPPDHDD